MLRLSVLKGWMLNRKKIITKMRRATVMANKGNAHVHVLEYAESQRLCSAQTPAQSTSMGGNKTSFPLFLFKLHCIFVFSYNFYI